MMKQSVTGTLNKYKSSWKTREEVNSTIRQLKDKLLNLQKSRSKELKKAKTSEDKHKIKLRYNNEIIFNDYLLYIINLEYYEIIGNLKK